MREYHGMTETAEYRIWCHMKERCSNPKYTGFHRYGGRGIKVCKEWEKSFTQFYKDMGPRPDGCELDRIDNNGNYSQGNCRWATRTQQQNNLSTNIRVTYKNEIFTVADLARHIGMKHRTLYSRIRRGASIEDACEKPLLYVTKKRKNNHVLQGTKSD